MEVVTKLKQFNLVPIPHEILKNSDKDIQSKMPKFNNMREKRIRILESMEGDYRKTLDSKEINLMIDDAIEYLSSMQDVLTETEYNAVKKMLIKRRKKIYKSTKDLRNTIMTKEKKTGVLCFNIQQARYERMEKLRKIIGESTVLMEQNSIENTEEELKKIKNSYAKEKQFAEVIKKLNTEEDNNNIIELQAYENRIKELEHHIEKAKQIVKEQEEKIREAKKELIILWKIEINDVIARKHNSLEITAPTEGKDDSNQSIEVENTRSLFNKLRKTSGGKHACT